MPYDRSQTTMQAFAMCPACQREYDDINNRRYHAQPNACPECGPKLDLRSCNGETIITNDIVKFALARLQEGAIIAMKSLGGFHLVVDANNENAVSQLRKRKHRDAKAFAIMVRDSNQAARIARVSAHEKKFWKVLSAQSYYCVNVKIHCRKSSHRITPILVSCSHQHHFSI